MKIKVQKRSDNYHAYIQSNPGKWDCGKTCKEAIANLRLTWPECQDCRDIVFLEGEWIALESNLVSNTPTVVGKKRRSVGEESSGATNPH